MYFDYLNLLLFASVGFVFVFVNVALGALLRPKRKTDQGLEIYECGEETIGDAWIRFDIRYYTVALVYVIFAVEIAFLFPWAIVLNDAFTDSGVAAGSGVGYFALVEGIIFIVILFLGLAYVWAKGDLDWVLAWEDRSFDPGAEREHAPFPRTLEPPPSTPGEGADDEKDPGGEEAA